MTHSQAGRREPGPYRALDLWPLQMAGGEHDRLETAFDTAGNPVRLRVPAGLAENGVPVERVHAGNFDHAEARTTRKARFFDQVTIGSASPWVYHHPDDENSS